MARRVSPCDCVAYAFPHRLGGGDCYVGKHCTYGESMQDVILALLQVAGVRSSDCGHVLDVDESCVHCYRLAARPLNVKRVAQNLGATLVATNENLEKLSPGTKVVIGMEAGRG